MAWIIILRMHQMEIDFSILEYHWIFLATDTFHTKLNNLFSFHWNIFHLKIILAAANFFSPPNVHAWILLIMVGEQYILSWNTYPYRSIQVARTSEDTILIKNRNVYTPSRSRLIPTGVEGNQTERNLQTHCWHQSEAYTAIFQGGK